MMNLLKYAGLTIFVVAALLAAFPTSAQEPEAGAKALFYDPATGATLKPSDRPKNTQTGMRKPKPTPKDKVKYVGIHYWIQLEGTGPVTSDRVFRTGDRIKLHVRSNVDGFLSLWTLDSSGSGKLLFPTSQKNDNFVKADTPYVTPGFITFTPPVEDERLLVFFSKSGKDIPSPTGSSADAQVVAKVVGATGEKALIFESEKKTPEEVGEYVVNQNGGPVAQEIRLKHQPGENE